MRRFSTRKRLFADPGLKAVTLELDRFGMPKPATAATPWSTRPGNRAGFLSFKKTWAIRCFLRPISDHAERYEGDLQTSWQGPPAYDVNFQFLKQGIQIRSSWFPIVKMQWADGDLCTVILRSIYLSGLTGGIAGKMVTLVRHLEAAQVAHGDLQHGNIVVRGGSIQLVDYDGMWVPALRGRHATETGHRAYQHPERSGQDYGQEIDRFSALVIYLSLAALERDVTLMGTFSYRRQSDLRARRFPAVGSIGDLATITSYRIPGNRSTRRCRGGHGAAAPMKVGNLDSVLKNPASYKFPTRFRRRLRPSESLPKPARVPTPPVRAG